MERRTHAALLVLVGVLLALAGPVAGGGMKATFAAAGMGLGGDAPALQRLMMSARLEDSVAPELTVDLELHRRILAGVITYGALNPNGPACKPKCPAPGRPYTGRGCKTVYQCPH